jgi:hypothetical protein
MKLSTDMPKTILKYSCTSFYRKDRSTKDFTYSDLKIKFKFANVLKTKDQKKERVFSLTGRIPEHVFGWLKIYHVFFVLYFLYLALSLFIKSEAKVM